MRTTAPPAVWPPWTLTLALIKPSAPAQPIRTELERTHDVLHSAIRHLTTDDTRRLYPEAYGAEYVAERDAYLTSGPVQVILLHTRQPVPLDGGRDQTAPHRGRCPATSSQIKNRIRATLGGDKLRNHLHMPDNPGEALADIGHLAGHDRLAELYERYERDQAPHRLAFYRTALGVSRSDPHRGAL